MDTPDDSGPRASTRTASSRPASQKSGRSSRTARSHTSSRTSEVTPLLARSPEEDDNEEEEEQEQATATTSLLRSLSSSLSSGKDGKKPFWKKRWPSIVALIILIIAIVFIMLGFLATEGIEEYAMQAAEFKPTKLSLDSLTDSGVRVQVEGRLQHGRIESEETESREAETGATDVDVYLPKSKSDKVRIGTAKIPGIRVNIRNGHTTHISFFAHLEPGSFEDLRDIANEWIHGRLKQIPLQGKADVPLRSGLLRLGSQTIEKTLTFEGDKLPPVPRHNITRLNLREAREGHKGMGADVSIMVTNDFPVQLTVPSVAVDVLVDGCLESDQHIMVGTAETAQLHVFPKTDVEVNVTDPDTPSWAHDLLKDITVPVPLPGREMGGLIRNFSMADVHFSLPDPWAEPGTPEAAPKISAIVKVDINLPDEMNFPLGVNHVKADADIFYHGKLLGKLSLKKWQDARSKRVDAHGDEGALLLVESDIKKGPVNIVDDELFSEVVQELIFGSKGVLMKVKASVSVEVDTPMGGFAVREIPAEGVVPVKPIGSGHGGTGHNVSSLAPKVGNLSIIETSRTSITLQANVNITNPTNYSATVPYFNINILVNKTVVGQAVAKDIYVHPGNNTNLLVTAVWDPYTHSGAQGKEIGRQLLSQYISGYNVSLTLQAHKLTIPSLPALGSILSNFPITLPAPRLSTPKPPSDDPDGGNDDDGDEEGDQNPTSSAPQPCTSSRRRPSSPSPPLRLDNPLHHLPQRNRLLRGAPAGKILYELPFAVPPACRRRRGCRRLEPRQRRVRGDPQGARRHAEAERVCGRGHQDWELEGGRVV
ncbi:hypothetical protein N0V90_007950 [Kalmusia sp. IMI 367209]|nr:hypothetical protein N0V90_007950 [Kalmusia sp. IMI 367209]